MNKKVVISIASGLIVITIGVAIFKYVKYRKSQQESFSSLSSQLNVVNQQYDQSNQFFQDSIVSINQIDVDQFSAITALKDIDNIQTSDIDKLKLQMNNGEQQIIQMKQSISSIQYTTDDMNNKLNIFDKQLNDNKTLDMSQDDMINNMKSLIETVRVNGEKTANDLKTLNDSINKLKLAQDDINKITNNSLAQLSSTLTSAIVSTNNSIASLNTLANNSLKIANVAQVMTNNSNQIIPNTRFSFLVDDFLNARASEAVWTTALNSANNNISTSRVIRIDDGYWGPTTYMPNPNNYKYLDVFYIFKRSSMDANLFIDNTNLVSTMLLTGYNVIYAFVLNIINGKQVWCFVGIFPVNV